MASGNCSSNKIELSVAVGGSQNPAFSIEMRGTLSQQAKLELERFDSCQFGLKPLTRIESEVGAVLLSYESLSVGLRFSLAFKAIPLNEERKEGEVKCGLDEAKCVSKYAGLSHSSCLPSELLCACPDDPVSRSSCRILVSRIANNEQSNFCEHLLTTNKKCMAQRETEERSVFVPESSIVECPLVNRSNEFGWLASPDFANGLPYSPGLNCFYRITLRHNQLVQLRFKYFNLNHAMFDWRRSSRNAELSLPDYDYVNIYDGPSLNSPLLAHLTSAHNDFTRNFNARAFNSHSNQV